MSKPNGVKLELYNKRNYRHYSKHTETEQHIVVQPVGHRRNKGKNKKVSEFNENENTTYQNLWNTAKAVLRGKFIAKSAYIKNTESSQINDIILHPKLLAKQEAAKLLLEGAK
jgi:hypothetical protein